jgi:hypothetical protein
MSAVYIVSIHTSISFRYKQPTTVVLALFCGPRDVVFRTWNPGYAGFLAEADYFAIFIDVDGVRSGVEAEAWHPVD